MHNGKIKRYPWDVSPALQRLAAALIVSDKE